MSATDASIRVRARHGVVLACGGFPHDVERRKEMFPHAPTGHEHYSPGPTGNTGDGLRLAESAGGHVEDRLPNAAAWVPVSVTTRKDGSSGVMPHFIDRAKPGVIAVMRDGKRFANEGNSYHDFVQAMIKAAKPGEEIAAYLDLRSPDACANTGSAACRRSRCRSAIISLPAISCAARRSRRLRRRPASIAKALAETVTRVQYDRSRGTRSRLRQGLASL